MNSVARWPEGKEKHAGNRNIQKGPAAAPAQDGVQLALDHPHLTCQPGSVAGPVPTVVCLNTLG